MTPHPFPFFRLADDEILMLVEARKIPAYKLEKTLGDCVRGVRIRRNHLEVLNGREFDVDSLPYEVCGVWRVACAVLVCVRVACVCACPVVAVLEKNKNETNRGQSPSYATLSLITHHVSAPPTHPPTHPGL